MAGSDVVSEPHSRILPSSMVDPDDVRAPTPFDERSESSGVGPPEALPPGPARIPRGIDKLAAWVGPPRSYRLTRSAILRLLGLVYLFAFLGLTRQILPLCGSHGLTPIATHLDAMREADLGFWDAPSLFWWGASDGALIALAYVGVALSLVALAGYANAPVMLALWVIYGSYARVGQLWFGFGWEIQLLETGFLAIFLAPVLDPRPLAARAPPLITIVLFRWLAFRIMLGAGLIKLRGDACWRELSCLDHHFETQPLPNPLSPWFHRMPGLVHQAGVLFNHVAELGAPWLAFGPRKARLVACAIMAALQVTLIVSGNLAFLNWLTLVPILALLDDDAILRMTPKRARAWLTARPSRPPRRAHTYVAGVLALVIAVLSIDVVGNLTSRDQAMNRSYDALDLVNTYGAFGSVGDTRWELVIEGTADAEDTPATVWRPYELPCKPGRLDRRPCVLGPYHRRLDWLIWFAAMNARPGGAPWVVHVVWKLLHGDRALKALLTDDPFPDAPPARIRIRRFEYHFAPSDAGAWWTRDHEELWLAPVAIDTPGLEAFIARYGWPSPIAR